MNYSVGIDVSKGKSTVVILDAAEKLQEKVFEVQHSQHGLEQLKNIWTIIQKMEYGL